MDSGRGIAPDHLRKLLIPYAIFDDSEVKQDGDNPFGLGLWLSKSIVEMHGGSLLAHSQGLGHGSTFIVALPVQAPLLSIDAGVCPDISHSSGVSRIAETTGVTRMSGGSQTYSHLADDDDEEKVTEMIPTALPTDTYSPLHARSSVDGYQRIQSDAAVVAVTDNNSIGRLFSSLYEEFISKCESISPLLQSRSFLFRCVVYYCVVSFGLCAIKVYTDMPYTESVDSSLIEQYPLPSWYVSAVLLLVPMIINYCINMLSRKTLALESRNESFYRLILIIGLLVPSSLSLLMWNWPGANLERFVVFVQVQLFIITSVLVSFSLLSLTFHCDISSADSEYVMLKKRLGRYTPMVFISFSLSKTLFVIYSFSYFNYATINFLSDLLTLSADVIAQYMLGAVVVYHIRQGNISKFESHNQLNDFLNASALFAYLFLHNVLFIYAGTYWAFVYVQAYITVGTLIFLSVIPSRCHIYYIRSVEAKLKIRVNVINYLSQEMKKPITDAIETATSAFKEFQSIANSFSRMSYDSDRDSIIVNLGEVLRDVLESCKVSEMTLEDLYVLDQLEDQKLVIEVESVNPWTLVHSVASPFSVVARSLGIQFTITSSYGSVWPEQLCLTCDKFKISQVVRNLISNALKFTPVNGEVSIILEHVIINEDSALYIVKVTDSGAGISAENQKKMFGQYVQFNAAALQKGKGSGLGLWISKQIVNLHLGDISVYSAGEGYGTTFTLTLPSQRMSLNLNSVTPPLTRNVSWDFSSFVRRQSLKSYGIITNTVIQNSLTMNNHNNDNNHDGDLVPPLSVSRSVSNIMFTNLSNEATEDTVSQITDVESYPSNQCNDSSLNLSGVRLSNHRSSKKVVATCVSSSCPVSPASLSSCLHSVLIVDDSGPTRRMVARRLTPLSFAVTEAKDGLECLALCGRSTTYDVILIDDAMPKLTGPEAIATLRAQGYSGLIVGVTGSADSDTMTKFKSSGADEVLTKPLDVDKFLYIFTQYENKKL